MGYPFPAGPCSYPAYPGYAGAAYGYAFVVVLLVVLLVIGGFYWLSVLSVVMIGVQETFPNLLTTGLMTVVIAAAVFNILKESLNKKDETPSK